MESVFASSCLSCATRMSISSRDAASAMTMVESLVMVTLRALPKQSIVAFMTPSPRSFAMKVEPVTMAMSCSKLLRRSPKPGALMAATLSTPRSLLTTRVASASPVMSSAMIRRGSPPFCDTASRIGMRSLTVSIFWSVTRMRAFSNSTCRRSLLVTNCAERYPRSISMPSSTSTMVSRPLPFSMDSTPSAPTFSMASAIMAPISSLLPAEMDATALMSELPLMGLASSSSLSVRKRRVLSMPFLMEMGLAPAVTDCRPRRIISRASTDAVVVPSPAESLVRPATSLMSCAPAFSTGSGSVMARAMVTPSLITWGMPNFSSSTTLRPRGPSVTDTASASWSMPR
mmetsp:Transcript_46071/g.73775  ORF Transcript_46071/g.73775 Transcript_46071/m.73775 type:complete len:344 (-) Transcript_46071:256-1287(-)